MTELFLNLLNRSIAASWLVLVVLLLRLICRRTPKWVNCLLWGLVAVRLVCPFSIESMFSLVPSAETVPQEIVYAENPAIHSGIHAVNAVVNPVLSETMAPVEYFNVTPMQVVLLAVTLVWVAGIVIMAFYTLGSWLHLRRKVKVSLKLEEGVWVCDEINTPFILGVIYPRIYLPFALEEDARPHVLAHERSHLKRRDHWWKPLGFALLAVNWYNPLMWVAYVLLCRDIELACDEKVIRDLGAEEKKGYSMALLECSVSRASIAACPLAFGEVGVKQRVKAVLNYKKPAFWVIAAAVVVCVIAGICFLTDPIDGAGGELEDALHEAILSEYYGREDGSVPFETHTVLGTQRDGDDITVYVMVLQQRYVYESGQVKEVSGSHMPMAYTFTKTEQGYELAERWQPKDGSYYISSIREKFPWYLWLRVDTQDYIDAHLADCQAQAEAYFKAHGSLTYTEEKPLDQYIWESDDGTDRKHLTLTMDWEYGSYTLEYSRYNNVYTFGEIEEGIFSVEGDQQLTLTSEDGEYRHVFIVENGTLIHDGKQSKSAPMLWIDDGAVLTLWPGAIMYGEYTSPDYPGRFGEIPRLTLDHLQGTYHLSYDSASSYYNAGEYRWDGNWLVLTSHDGRYIYTFRYEDGALVYLAWASDPIGEVPDGAVFGGEIEDQLAHVVPCWDAVEYDVDNDGVVEQCVLGYGPTSGLFTFTFDVYEDGTLEYSSVFNTPWYDLSFVVDEQNALWVRGVTQGDKPEEHLFGVIMKDGYVALSEEGDLLPMWGEVLRSLDFDHYLTNEVLGEMNIHPHLVFNREEQTYSFDYASPISSYLDFGSYELEAGILRLYTGDGQFFYTFQRDGDALIYSKALSAPYPMMSLSEGAVFYPVRDEGGAIESAVWFDIDNDSIDEYCTIREGTAADTTRRIRIYENGVLEYSGLAAGEAFEITDGTLRLTRIPEWEGQSAGWYEITLQGDEAVLSLHGVA